MKGVERVLVEPAREVGGSGDRPLTERNWSEREYTNCAAACWLEQASERCLESGSVLIARRHHGKEALHACKSVLDSFLCLSTISQSCGSYCRLDSLRAVEPHMNADHRVEISLTPARPQISKRASHLFPYSRGFDLRN